MLDGVGNNTVRACSPTFAVDCEIEGKGSPLSAVPLPARRHARALHRRSLLLAPWRSLLYSPPALLQPPPLSGNGVPSLQGLHQVQILSAPKAVSDPRGDIACPCFRFSLFFADFRRNRPKILTFHVQKVGYQRDIFGVLQECHKRSEGLPSWRSSGRAELQSRRDTHPGGLASSSPLAAPRRLPLPRASTCHGVGFLGTAFLNNLSGRQVGNRPTTDRVPDQPWR